MEKDYLKSFLSNNPVMILFLAACPALAGTTNVVSGLVLAGAVFCILVLSSLVMALLGKITMTFVRLALSVIVTAGFASMANLLIAAFLPSASSALGIYVVLCALNAMLVLKGSVASDSSVGTALKNAVICGLEFALLVIIMAIIRETLGLGTFAGHKVEFLSAFVIPILAKNYGAFIVFAILLAVAGCFKCKACEAKSCEAKSCEASSDKEAK